MNWNFFPIQMRSQAEGFDPTALAAGLTLLGFAGLAAALMVWRRSCYLRIRFHLLLTGPVLSLFLIGMGLNVLGHQSLGIRRLEQNMTTTERAATDDCRIASRGARGSEQIMAAIKLCESTYRALDPNSQAAHIAVGYTANGYDRLDRMKKGAP